MPDAKRFKPVAAKPAESSPVDPRLALAQKYLKSASVEVAEKAAAESRSHRPAAVSGGRQPKAFSLSISPATLVHIPLAMIVFTFASLAVLWCYHLLLVVFVAGRVVALPTGVVVAATLSYLSALFLGIVETTSIGRTEVDSLAGDWQDWFWTLPSTLGMLALSSFIGWFLSLGLPVNVWVLMALCALFLYPILQLSSLETGSPLAPLSLPVLKSLVQHPFGWFVFYAITFVLVNILWTLGKFFWRDPPYVTILIMGPLVCLALLFYAWLLGQLASLISKERVSS